MTKTVPWSDFNLGALLEAALKGKALVIFPGEEGVEVLIVDHGHLMALSLLQQKEQKKPKSQRQKEVKP